MSDFDPKYAEQLRQRYPESICNQIIEDVQHAPLPEQPGETLPYVYIEPVSEPSLERPLFCVPGFSEGIINKASFAAELALNGAEVILPGQNRRSMARDVANKRSSLFSQARNYLAVLNEAAGPKPVDVLTHSFGAQIFEEMTKHAPGRFADSQAILLAPSGSIHNQTLPNLSTQWIKMMKSESDQSRPCEFPDKHGVTGRASLKNLLANVPRTLFEVGDVVKGRINYPELVSSVGQLTIASYAEDALFPESQLHPTLDRAVKAGATWVTPVDFNRVVSGEMRYGGHGATHDDEQFNPSRVAATVIDLVSAK